jgi:hypothetical protein
VAGEPEGLDVVTPHRVDDHRYHVLQIGIVLLRPPARRGVRRGNDEAVLLFLLECREVAPLPGAARSAAMEAEDERHLLPCLQVARVIEQERPAGLGFGDLLGAGGACGAEQSYRLLR